MPAGPIRATPCLRWILEGPCPRVRSGHRRVSGGSSKDTYHDYWAGVASLDSTSDPNQLLESIESRLSLAPETNTGDTGPQHGPRTTVHAKHRKNAFMRGPRQRWMAFDRGRRYIFLLFFVIPAFPQSPNPNLPPMDFSCTWTATFEWAGRVAHYMRRLLGGRGGLLGGG